MSYNRILVVEDDPAVAGSLRDGLEQDGYVVTWAPTGTEGVDHLHSGTHHLVLLDVRLPDGLGFDFCRQMRDSGFAQPIIMLTVRKDETDKVLGLEMGADDYVTKPFGLRELLSRIRANLRRSYGALSGPERESLIVGNLTIDELRGVVRRDNEVILLTPTEFRMLTYLARNVGQVLSRAQILDTVWGYEASVDNERTVNVHIRRLREKVEVEPSRPTLILTVPGMGYRLVEPQI